MRKYLLLVSMIMACLFGQIEAKDTEPSYNMRRALEEIDNGNALGAISFINKEITENPRNGFAHLTMAMIYSDLEDYQESLKSLETALRFLPSKSKERRSAAYEVRGEVYLQIGDTLNALADYDTAMKLNPRNEDALMSRAQILYSQNKFDESDNDFKRLKEINPANPAAEMGLGRNELDRGNYESALKHFNASIKLDEKNAGALGLRGKTKLAMKDYAAAADDLVASLAETFHLYTLEMLSEFPKDQLPMIKAKLKAQALKEPYTGVWYAYLGNVLENKHQYAEAIESYKQALKVDEQAFYYDMLGDAYRETGQFREAIKSFRKAQDLEPGELDYIDQKIALMTEFMGDNEKALDLWDKFIEANPDESFAFYRKGYILNNLRKYDEALENFEMSLLLRPASPYALLGKADVLSLKGDGEKAMECYRRILELDSVPSLNSCAMYAYQALGENEKAAEFMTKVLELDPEDSGNYYDAACLYARMGNLDQSLEYLKKAFDNGFVRSGLIFTDDDLDKLRETDAFKEFYESNIDKFERVEVIEPAEEAEGANTTEVKDSVESGVSKRIEIPYTPDYGCAKVKCTINDLPLSFVFDTGAAIVSISKLEADFMLKNGFLTPDDFIGSGRFINANGEVYDNAVINLREVEFGGFKLQNIRASVVSNQKAPLLLGQTVLGRLGKIEIDNENMKLIITSR